MRPSSSSGKELSTLKKTYIMKAQKAPKNIPTHHLDKDGKMIHRGDCVRTINGTGVVVWVGRHWMIRYAAGAPDPLNGHPAKTLKRCDKGQCDKCDTAAIVTEAKSDKFSPSQPSSQELSWAEKALNQADRSNL